MPTMDELQAEISQWGRETFGADHRVEGCLNHFFDEVVELAQRAGMFGKLRDSVMDNTLTHYQRTAHSLIPEEAADCVILLLNTADLLGFSLQEAVERKHAINLKRRWGPVDSRGVSKHVEANRD